MNKKKSTIDSLTSYYEAILALVPGNLYWKDKKGVLQGCNNNLAKLLGLNSCKEISNKTDYDIASKNEAEAIRKVDFEVMRNKREQVNEEYFKLPNGSQICYLTQRSPVLDEHGEVVGLIGISFDITDRKKIEEDLRIAKDKAEAASHAKDDFISNMQHDLRTPFTGIGGMANVLYAMSEEKYPEFSEFIKIMIKSCEQWENIHHRIFDVLAVEQIAPINIEQVSISKEVKNMQDMLAATLHLKKIRCILKPVSPELDMIETDALKFHLILSSLISNAVNFTEEGEVTVTVSNEHNCRIMKVIDTGIGIPTDKLEYIFEKFTKLSRSNKYGGKFQGVGLGLYTARSYANQLGATIHVDSQLGKGSTFYIKLPIKEK